MSKKLIIIAFMLLLTPCTFLSRMNLLLGPPMRQLLLCNSHTSEPNFHHKLLSWQGNLGLYDLFLKFLACTHTINICFWSSLRNQSMHDAPTTSYWVHPTKCADMSCRTAQNVVNIKDCLPEVLNDSFMHYFSILFKFVLVQGHPEHWSSSSNVSSAIGLNMTWEHQHLKLYAIDEFSQNFCIVWNKAIKTQYFSHTLF